MKYLYLIILMSLIWVNNVHAQVTNGYGSRDIYKFTGEISKIVGSELWEGFDPLKYTVIDEKEGSATLKFSPNLDNPKSWIIMRLSDSYFKKSKLTGSILISFHEAFHAFQRNSERPGGRWGAENSMLIFEYQESSARNNMLFSIESKVLLAALRTKIKKDFRKRVREFLAIRKLRQSELSERFVNFEKGAELNEGLAEYVGAKAVKLAIEAAESKKINLSFAGLTSQAYLMDKYKRLESITKIGSNVRLKFYYTGSAQAFLLDRLLPGWKKEVQMRGTPLQDLLERGLSTSENTKMTTSVMQRLDYGRILKDERIAVERRNRSNRALLQKTLSQIGVRMIVDFSSLRGGAQIQFFDPMNVTMISEKMRIHTRMVKFKGGDDFVAKYDQSVVEDLEKKRYTTTVSKTDRLKILADGKELDLEKPGEYFFNKKLEILSRNFTFEGKKGAVKIDKDGVFVKVSEG